MKILLIAGHGAGDPGACAKIGGVQYREAEETRKMVTLLQPLLAGAADVSIYDQSRDAYKDSQAGVLAGRLTGWDYVLEIHFNAGSKDLYGNGYTTGSEIFWPSRNNKASGTENAILDRLAALGLTKRRAGANALAVINTAAGRGCKANLLEVCFIDDADDMRLYASSRRAVAQAIADGVIAGLGLEDNMTKEQMLEKLGDKFIKTYDELPDWAKPGMREILDQQAINGGTDYATDPNDINMFLSDIKVLLAVRKMVR